MVSILRPLHPWLVPEDDEAPFGSEPVEIPIGDSLDLHYFPPRDAGEIVDAYLEAAAERGFREVRIIPYCAKTRPSPTPLGSSIEEARRACRGIRLNRCVVGRRPPTR